MIGEAQYYFRLKLKSAEMALAMISAYGDPNPALLRLSSGALYSSEYFGLSKLEVINVKCIQSVVAMIKHTFGYDSFSIPPDSLSYEGFQFTEESLKNSYFLVEKLGLEVLTLNGYEEDIDDQ